MPTVLSREDLAVRRRLLAAEDTFATTLLLLTVDAYPELLWPEDGEEPGWHPRTLREQLEKDFSLTLPQLSLDKILAALRLVLTDDFHTDLAAFLTTCNVFSGSEASEEFDPADAGELLWGMTEAALISPPDDESVFVPEIAAYVARQLKEEGILDPPDLLAIAGPASGETSFVDDDPELLAGISEIRRGQGDELRGLVAVRLDELAEELGTLRLENGSTTRIVVELRKLRSAAGHGESA